MFRGRYPRLAATVGSVVVAATLLATPAPAAAQETCVKRDITVVAESILFGTELASFTMHIEHCWDGNSVRVKKYAPTIITPIDPLVVITVVSDPADAWVDQYGRGRFQATFTVTTGFSAGGHAIGSSCTMTANSLFLRTGDWSYSTLGCAPFYSSGLRVRSFKGAGGRVPFYLSPAVPYSLETLTDPMSNPTGKVRIYVEPGTPGCPGPNRCPLTELVVEGDGGGITDPTIRNAVYGVAQTVPN